VKRTLNLYFNSGKAIVT